MLSPSLLTRTSLFGFGVAFSPLSLAVVSLLLLGRDPLRRALSFVIGWAAANALTIVVLMLLGDAFAIDPGHGQREQVLIDLLGAGALAGLGLHQLTPQAHLAEEGMVLRLMNRLPQFGSVSLLLIGATSALLNPENLVFFLKQASLLLLNDPGVRADAAVTALFTLVASSLLLLPPLAWMLSGGAIREPVARLEDWLRHRAEALVGMVALALAMLLFSEGLHGLELMRQLG